MRWRTGHWLVLCLCLAGRPLLAQDVGTDLAGLNLCLYGDCEARGSYAADPYGWTNPATMPAGILPHVSRAVLPSFGFFRANVGTVATDVDSVTVSGVLDPVVFQVNGVYAEASGGIANTPGVELDFRTRMVRLAAAVDLGRAKLGPDGLSLGLMGTLPVTDGEVKVKVPLLRATFLSATEDRDVDLVGGVHWRTGKRDWFMAGGFLCFVHNDVVMDGIDQTTFREFHETGTTNVWIARVGVSMLPFVPLDVAPATTPLGEWLGEMRLGIDVQHKNLASPGESSRKENTGYFGIDLRLLPDAWNPVSRFFRLQFIAGVDTDAGWGIGPGLYGNGPLQFLSCNPAYSSRPIAESLGGHFNLWSAGCGAVVPF